MPLHPQRRLFHRTTVKIERCTDGDDYGDVQSIAVQVGPPFLFGAAETDPDDVGLGLVDGVDDCRCFLLSDGQLAGGGDAGDVQTGVPGRQAAGHFLGDAGSAAVEVMAVAGCG